MNGLKKWWLLSFMFLLFLGGGCSTDASTTVLGSVPTVLQIQRVNTESNNHYPPFSPRTITNKQLVQQVYTTIQLLPRFTNSAPSGIQFCPADRGLKYQLTFLHGHDVLQTDLYDPAGCPTLRIGKNDIRYPDQAFAQFFAQILGIPVNDLAPPPLYSCNFRSPCASPTP